MPTNIPISDVVDVVFNIQQAAQPNRGFGRLLVVGDSPTSTLSVNTPKLYDSQTWDSQMLADGYLATDEEYTAVQTWFSQSPRPTDCLVARTAATPTATDLAAIEILDDSWYFLTVACTALQLTTAEFKNIAAWVETKTKMFGYTDADTANVAVPFVGPTVMGDVKDLYKRSFTVYDDNDLYAHVSIMARLATVNYLVANASITTKFKRLPGISPMRITKAQANSIRGNNGNYYAYYADTPMFAEGKMTDGTWLDIVHGTDWLQNAIQTEVFNKLVTTPTKIDQQDSGVAKLTNAVLRIAELARLSGFLAKGVWRGDDLGRLKNGDYMKPGYHIEAMKVDDMPAADIAARKAPPIIFAGRLSGAIHSAYISGYLA